MEILLIIVPDRPPGDPPPAWRRSATFAADLVMADGPGGWDVTKHRDRMVPNALPDDAAALGALVAAAARRLAELRAAQPEASS